MPEAKVTIACGPLPQSVFEGYPALAEIIPFQKEKYHLHWVKLWSRLAGRRWDMIIDLRNSALSRLLPARTRHIYGPQIDQSAHKVVQAAQVMGITAIPAPKLWFTEAQQAQAAALISEGGPVLGIGPTANWAGKTWPVERFIGLIKILTGAEGILPGARVAVFAAPGEERAARKVFDSLPAERRIDVMAKADPGTAAAALARCALYIGNDSGLMHSAAAAGIPTVGLFGPSWPHLYGPWGVHTLYVSTPESFEQLTAFPGYDPKTCGCLMGTLTLEKVAAAIEEWWPQRQMNSQARKH